MMCKRWEECHRRTGNIAKMKCWSNWQLCGYHAALEHPEEYDPHWVAKILTKGLKADPGGRLTSKHRAPIQRQKEGVAFFAPESTF